MNLLHFHSNVTVLWLNNGFAAVTQQFKQKHYYGYGSVIEERDFRQKRSSWVRERVEVGRYSERYGGR
jgi:hypothetical protein